MLLRHRRVSWLEGYGHGLFMNGALFRENGRPTPLIKALSSPAKKEPLPELTLPSCFFFFFSEDLSTLKNKETNHVLGTWRPWSCGTCQAWKSPDLGLDGLDLLFIIQPWHLQRVPSPSEDPFSLSQEGEDITHLIGLFRTDNVESSWFIKVLNNALFFFFFAF